MAQPNGNSILHATSHIQKPLAASIRKIPDEIKMTETFITLLVLLTIILWIWALIDIYKSNFKNEIFKIICFIVVIFSPILGSIIYFQFKNKITSRRKFEPNFQEPISKKLKN